MCLRIASVSPRRQARLESRTPRSSPDFGFEIALPTQRSPPTAADAAMLALLTTSLGVKLLRRFDASSFGASWPYSELDLARMDPSPDIQFYETPRFVTHIDDGAIRALTDFYRQELTSGADVLDLCSSWISHLPDELALGRVAGVGMNARELERNERLTEFASAT